MATSEGYIIMCWADQQLMQYTLSSFHQKGQTKMLAMLSCYTQPLPLKRYETHDNKNVK